MKKNKLNKNYKSKNHSKFILTYHIIFVCKYMKLFKENGAKGSCMCVIHPVLKDNDHIKTTLNELCDYIRENYDMNDVI